MMDRDDLVAAVLEVEGRLIRTSMRAQSRTLVSANLTPVQFHLLLFLHANPGTPTADAAEAMGLKPNITTGVVQRLVDRGWVERRASDADGRVRLLSLTPAGEVVVNGAIAEAEQSFVAHIHVLSDEQIEQLHGILTTIEAAARD